jgi:hypothetical protein
MLNSKRSSFHLNQTKLEACLIDPVELILDNESSSIIKDYSISLLISNSSSKRILLKLLILIWLGSSLLINEILVVYSCCCF